MEGNLSAFNPRQTMRGDDIEIYHYFDAHPGDIGLHHHDFYEVYLFLSGRVEYQIENRSYPLAEDDLLVISPSELHQPLFQAKEPYERIVLWIDRRYLQELTQSNLLNLKLCFDAARRARNNLIKLPETERKTILPLFDLLLREQQTTDYGSEAMRAAAVTQLLILLGRLSPSPPLTTDQSGARDELVDRVFDYINVHIAEDLSLQKLQTVFFFDGGTLTRRFRQQLGTTLSQYVRKKRLTIARNLLSEGCQPGEVYARCGFLDYSGFFRAFRQQYGMSPKTFAETIAEK